MKKLIVTLVGLLTAMLLIGGGCGADAGVDWSEFFNEYYSECVQLCETCAEWAEMCNLEYSTEKCINLRWFNGQPNIECTWRQKDINNLIINNSCVLEFDYCLLDAL